MRLSWWKARLVEGAVALVIVSTILSISSTVALRQKEMQPATAWLTVNEVFVPDFAAGSLPDLIYDLVAYEAFEAFKIVEVQRKTAKGLWATACSGHGIETYNPDTEIESNMVFWSSFIGRDCNMPPGQYRLKTTHVLSRPDWPEKRLFSLSNEFRILTAAEAAIRGEDHCPLCGRSSQPQ